MRRTRLPLAIGGGMLLAGLALLVLVAPGLLAFPTPSRLAALEEVPRQDILEWQAIREADILRDYGAGSYTLARPFVVLDPYEMNPLSALVIFETARPARIRVAIEGEAGSSSFDYELPGLDTHHEVPVLGLYAGRETGVRMAARYGDGSGESTVLRIGTEPLPPDFQEYDLRVAMPGSMEPGMTLLIACFEDSYTCVVDERGRVRAYLSRRRMGHGTAMIQLGNGAMLGTGDEYRQLPYNMASLWEFNWLGKLFREYEIPNGVHHDISELPDGDILASSNSRDLFSSGTREDVAVIIERETGEVTREYDFREILDETRDPHHHFHPDILNAPNVDWMHMNAALRDANDGGIIVSSPTQSMVVKIDASSGMIRWILGPHEGYEGSSAGLARYLLEPEGGGFEWQWCQHEPMIMPDQDGNPDTIDLLLLDNGQSRSFSEAGAMGPEENHSRGVQYRIDERRMTVRQIWEYGRERGSECYATFLGDADWLPMTGNRLLVFGGQLRKGGKPTDDILAGVFGTDGVESRIVEVDEAGEVVFELAARGNRYSTSAETYQAERIQLFSPQSHRGGLGGSRGGRVGESLVCAQMTDVAVPPLFLGDLRVRFSDLHREGDRLVVDGELSRAGKTYLLGRAYLAFRSAGETRVYAATSGLNGRFFASIDLAGFPAGAYQLTVIGAVRVGNDAAQGKMHGGHSRTGFKVTVED